MQSSIQYRSPVFRYSTIWLLLFGLVFISLPVWATGTGQSVHQIWQQDQAAKEQLLEKWGIEITALRLTAADHMIDFRYRVLDKDKAAPLHKRQVKPYLLHQKSGKVLSVPNTAKVGALRNSYMPQKGRIYWMFFGNSGLVKKGDKVSVVIGDFRAENLIVR